MKFPLESRCKFLDLLYVEVPRLNPYSGRIYMFEVGNLVKVGASTNLPGRTVCHKYALQPYGLTSGSAAYSLNIRNVIDVEKMLHRSLCHLRVNGCREVYKSSIDALIELFDAEYSFPEHDEWEKWNEKQEEIRKYQLEIENAKRQKRMERKMAREAKITNGINSGVCLTPADLGRPDLAKLKGAKA